MIGLRERLFKIIVTSAVMIIAAVTCAVFAIYFAQQNLTYNRVAEKMESKLSSQLGDLIASFLIPEQAAGRTLLLQKYLESEDLTQALVVLAGDPLPSDYKHCEINIKPSRCKSESTNTIAVVAPIEEAGITFGYFLKTKKAGNPDEWVVFQSAAIALLALIFVTIINILLMSRVYTKVATSISALEDWTDKVVSGSTSEDSPSVHFREFLLLGKNIGKIVRDGTALKEQAVASEIAKQVAHDIRAPATALSVMVECMDQTQLSEENRAAIHGATQRIKDIANSLIKRSFKGSNKVEVSFRLEDHLVSEAIDAILIEKKAQFSKRTDLSIKFENQFPEAKSKIDCIEFKRVLSNLLNNAIEAIEGPGEINVRLAKEGNFASIEVADTGIGIPLKILSRLGERGFSYKRTEGSGLGLFHAKKTINAFNGQLTIDSIENKGTIVRLYLPLLDNDKGFHLESLPTLQMKSVKQVVVIDDDPSIHRTWELRFQNVGKNAETLDVLHFYNFEEAKNWYLLASQSIRRIFLVDYDLGEDERNGLDLIEELRIEQDSILVSSRADDPAVQARAQILKIRILPKHMSSSVPITFNDEINEQSVEAGGKNESA